MKHGGKYGEAVGFIRTTSAFLGASVRPSDIVSDWFPTTEAAHLHLCHMAAAGQAISVPPGNAPGRWEPRFKVFQINAAGRPQRKVTYFGCTKLLSQWEREFGYNHGLIRCRLNRGWSEELAIATKPRKKHAPVNSAGRTVSSKPKTRKKTQYDQDNQKPERHTRTGN